MNSVSTYLTGADIFILDINQVVLLTLTSLVSLQYNNESESRDYLPSSARKSPHRTMVCHKQLHYGIKWSTQTCHLPPVSLIQQPAIHLQTIYAAEYFAVWRPGPREARQLLGCCPVLVPVERSATQRGQVGGRHPRHSTSAQIGCPSTQRGTAAPTPLIWPTSPRARILPITRTVN